MLNKQALRRMAVLRPLKVVINNYPESGDDELEAVNNPEDASAGVRPIRFGREIYIERDDFMEDPPKKFFRLAPGREVRLRAAYLVTCTEVVKDANGEITEVRARYDPATRGGDAPDGRRVKGTLHWVSAAHALDAEIRLYNQLFTDPEPGVEADFRSQLNPDSIEVLEGAKLEPTLAQTEVGKPVQFERQGYFCLDSDSDGERLVFNRTVGLRDSWAKIQGRIQDRLPGMR
jgi:glutaminyl-tRNA synthetase